MACVVNPDGTVTCSEGEYALEQTINADADLTKDLGNARAKLKAKDPSKELIVTGASGGNT